MGAWLTAGLTALASASSLFLVSAGLTLVFGVTRVVNFAQGSLTMVGAYVAWTVLRHLPPDPSGFAAGVVLTVATLAAAGTLLEMSLLRRLYRAPELLQLLATFGVLLMVQDLVPLIWGPDDLPLPRPPWMRGFILVGGERFPRYDLLLIAAGPAVLGLLWLLLHRTRWGRLVRAATADRDMVGCLGIDSRALFTAVFALGAGLAGLAGALALPDGSANGGIDLAVVAEAFVVVVVGGMGSIGGAFGASLLLSWLQAVGIVLAPALTPVLVFAAMALVLALRPQGLAGVGDDRVVPAAAVAMSPMRPAGRVERWAGAALLTVAVLLPALAPPWVLAIGTEAAVAVLFAASLHLLMGPGGLPSFGHAAWFAIGAYAAAFASKLLGMPGALAMAPVAAGLMAALFGLLVMRLSGIYLAMLTLAAAQIVWTVAVQWVGLTGGDNGLLGIWPPAWAASPRAFYWLTVAVCAGATLLLRRLIRSPLGYALRAARDAPARADAIGLPSAAVRVAAIAASGAAAGLAGAMFTFGHGSAFPTYATIPRSLDALLMVLLGGVGTLSGPIVGALAYTGLSDVLLRTTGLWRLVLGASTVALVLLFPAGLAGAWPRRARG